jgi:nucleotide-binding universal stress UspA family protein
MEAGLRYRHVMAATDFSALGDLAVKRAAELAKANGARLTLVHVLPEQVTPSPLVPHYYDVGTDVERLKLAKEAAGKALRERAPEGVDVDVHVRVGDPSAEILAAESEHKPDLIVVATHGRTGISRWLMGSVATRVVGHAHTDVMVVRDQER